MEAVCRVCMNGSVTLVDLFNKQAEQPEEHSLAEMLTECVNCEVQQDDPLPNHICLTCVVDTKNAFRFKRKCEKSHLHFWQLFQIQNYGEGSSSTSEQQNHEWSFEKVDCIKSAEEAGDPGVAASAREATIGIDECELNWQVNAESKPKDLDSLRKKFEPEINILTVDATPSAPKELHLCDICGKELSDAGLLKEHILIHSTEDRPFLCPFCSKGFNQRSHLRAHVRVHTGERPYECTVCSKVFAQSHHLKDHMLSHSGERPFPCPHCPKSFNRNANLQTHLIVHSGERPYVCPLCPATFNHPSNLEKHSRIHSGKRPYECSQCPKTFTRRQHLNTHALVHTNDRPFHCEKCTRDFRSRPGLKKHICVPPEPLKLPKKRKTKFNPIVNLRKAKIKEADKTEIDAPNNSNKIK